MFHKSIAAGLCAVALTATSALTPSTAQTDPPLPPPRPENPPAATRQEPPAAPTEAPAATPAPTAAEAPAAGSGECLARLKAAGFTVEIADQPQSANPQCRIDQPVKLSAVPVPSRPGTSVRFAEQPVLACRFADSFGRWVGDLAAPVIAGTLGKDLKAVRTGPGFECRNRNRAATGKLSAHGEGLAVDIAGFELTDGSVLRIEPARDGAPNPALAALRKAGCGWFTTILGPGSDASHDDHLHVDIIRHGSSDRYRICD